MGRLEGLGLLGICAKHLKVLGCSARGLQGI
jgi:hypothetical protein